MLFFKFIHNQWVSINIHLFPSIHKNLLQYYPMLSISNSKTYHTSNDSPYYLAWHPITLMAFPTRVASIYMTFWVFHRSHELNKVWLLMVVSTSGSVGAWLAFNASTSPLWLMLLCWSSEVVYGFSKRKEGIAEVRETRELVTTHKIQFILQKPNCIFLTWGNWKKLKENRLIH